MKYAGLMITGLVLALGGCVPDKLNTEPEVRGLKGAASVQQLTDPVSGMQITLRPGSRAEISFPANPSTGYIWQIVPGWNNQVMDLTQDEYIADPAPEGVVGSGGTQFYEFIALSPGETSLLLIYSRPGQEPGDTRTLQFRVIQ